MQEFEPLYNKSRMILLNIDQIGVEIGQLKIESFKMLKVVKIIKQLINNSLAEMLILNNYLYELLLVETESELSDLLEITEWGLEDESD